MLVFADGLPTLQLAHRLILGEHLLAHQPKLLDSECPTGESGEMASAVTGSGTLQRSRT